MSDGMTMMMMNLHYLFIKYRIVFITDGVPYCLTQLESPSSLPPLSVRQYKERVERDGDCDHKHLLASQTIGAASIFAPEFKLLTPLQIIFSLKNVDTKEIQCNTVQCKGRQHQQTYLHAPVSTNNRVGKTSSAVTIALLTLLLVLTGVCGCIYCHCISSPNASEENQQ